MDNLYFVSMVFVLQTGEGVYGSPNPRVTRTTVRLFLDLGFTQTRRLRFILWKPVQSETSASYNNGQSVPRVYLNGKKMIIL